MSVLKWIMLATAAAIAADIASGWQIRWLTRRLSHG